VICVSLNGGLGGRVPHFSKEQFLDLSKVNVNLVRLGLPLSAFNFG